MTNLSKHIDYQQRVAKAAEELLKHFGEEVDLTCHYMRMAKAQTQIISLMRLSEISNEADDEEILVPRHVSLFFNDCSDIFRLLEPLDNLANEAENGIVNMTGKANPSKLERQLVYQQRVNKAVENLLSWLGQEYGLKDIYREMALAQSQIMSLMLVYEQTNTSKLTEQILFPSDVALFLCNVNMLLEMIEPLDAIAREGLAD